MKTSIFNMTFTLPPLTHVTAVNQSTQSLETFMFLRALIQC